ncbi:MAG: hypothetical protein EON59_00230 [Alphaproteobacteria bacterium]|nr:MAG: hypothetical protein EON59_00230 [Alphaproteobacteria bacterium]
MNETYRSIPELKQAIDSERLCKLAGVDDTILSKWRDKRIFEHRATPESDSEWRGSDVMIVAVLARLAALRTRDSHLRCVARDLYIGLAQAAQLPASNGTGVDFLYHAYLCEADKGGYFTELARAPGADPRLMLYGSYPDYCRGLALAGELPSVDLLAAANQANLAAADLIALFLDLTSRSNAAEGISSPIWNFVPFHDEMVIQPRISAGDMARDISDGSEISCFITLSVPALAREVAERAGAMETETAK